MAAGSSVVEEMVLSRSSQDNDGFCFSMHEV